MPRKLSAEEVALNSRLVVEMSLPVSASCGQELNNGSSACGEFMTDSLPTRRGTF